jgi:S-DNA-T family DNA segregation ATPase FtsK/SpoIIIE
LIAAAVLVLLTLRRGETGLLGRSLAYGLRWLFGESTIAVALLVILVNLRTLLGEAGLSGAKRGGLLLWWLALAAGLSVAPLLAGRLINQVGVEEALQLAEQGGGGGIVGGLLAMGLLRLLAETGTQVVLGGLVVAGLVLLTTPRARQSFWHFLRRAALLSWRSLAGIARLSAEAVVWVGRGFVSFCAAGDSGEGPRLAEEPRRPPVLPVEPTPAPAKSAPAQARDEESEGPTIRTYVLPPAGEEVAAAVQGTQLALLSGKTIYQLPPLSLLCEPIPVAARQPVRNLSDQARLLEETLDSFGVKAKVVHIDQGPVVTRFELQPAPGVKVSRIVSLADDLALSLAAADVRIEAPIPGKAAVGIEVPNKETALVHLREILATPEFENPQIRLPLALGKDIAGTPIVCDLVDMPHLLIAGATGSGKSVCLNTMIASILYRLRPDEVKVLMIDPKRVELAAYDGTPHLLAPVVTDPKKAAAALKWVVEEMEKRYELFASSGVRNIDKYNALSARAPEEATEAGEAVGPASGEAASRPLPYLVVCIDELADLMMVAAAEVEDSVCRLAQMARAAGIHLVIATQRPSVDVITGLIKANIPSRIAFAVSSQVDSRTILDMAGAERLLGKGDMLFCAVGAVKPLRVQGAYITDREVEALVGFWRRQGQPEYQADLQCGESRVADGAGDDELYDDAVRLVISTGNASISMVQRRFRIGYARAARLIDMMELAGVVGPYQGSKPREVLVSGAGEN